MQLVGGIVGAVIGFYIGGPVGAQWGFAIGAGIGGYLGAPDTVGPRLQDRAVQVSSYGAGLSIIEGGVRIPGNVIWAVPLEEHENSESSKGGPETITFSYTVSCAVAIADAGTTPTFPVPRIRGVRRIWADAKLVYDITETADAQARAASAAFRKYFVFYDGGEDQMPDPTMEAIKGVGEVPAYRGVAMVVFTDLPVGDYGNRIPSFSFETTTAEAVVSNVESIAPMQLGAWSDTGLGPNHSLGPTEYTVSSPTGAPWFGATFTFDNFAAAQAKLIEVFGPEYDTYVGYYTSTNPLLSAFEPNTGINDGNGARYAYLAFNYGAANVIVNRGAVSESITNADAGGVHNELFCADMSRAGATPGDGNVYMLSSTDGTGAVGHEGYLRGLSYDVHSGDPVGLPPNAFGGNNCVRAYIGEPDYSMLGGFASLALHQFIRVERKLAPPPPTCLPGLDPCSPDGPGITELPGNPDFCMTCAGLISPNIRYTVTSGSYKQLQALANGSDVVTKLPLGPVMLASDPRATDSAFWTAAAADAGVSGTYGVDFPVTVTQAGIGGTVYETADAGTELLSDVVTRMSERAGLTPSQIDVTDLEDTTVLGAKWTRQMPARAAIEPLRQAYAFDAVERARQVVFVKRGGASAITIGADDLGAAEGDGSEPLVRTTRAEEEELPRVVNVVYEARSADYQVGVQSDRRTTVGSKQEATVELPVVLTDDAAANAASRLLYETWLGRNRRTFSTLRNFTHLEPTDRITIDDGEFEYVGRIVDKTEDGPVIKWELVDEDAASYQPQMTGVPTSGGGSTIRFDGPMRVVLMDIPIVRDADNDAGFYAAAAGYFDGWRGGTLYRSTDGGATYAALQEMNVAATMGNAQSVLGSWSGGNVVDELNSVTVKLHAGSLASITREALLANGNAAVLGNEIVLFQRAELVAPKTYVLTGLLRGRQGTEQHIGTHTATDRFVLLSPATVYRVPVAADQVGVAAKYKAVGLGTAIADAPELDFTNTAAGLKPLSPAHLTVVAQGAASLATWVRRTRIGGVWADGVDVPLGEAAEAYEIDLFDPDDALVGTLTSSVPSVSLGGWVAGPDTRALYHVAQDGSGPIVGVAEYFSMGDSFATLVCLDPVTGATLGAAGLGGVGGYPLSVTGIVVVGDYVFVAYINGASPSGVKRIAIASIVAGLITATHTYSTPALADAQGLCFDGTHLWLSLAYTGAVKVLATADLSVFATHTAAAAVAPLTFDVVSGHIFAGVRNSPGSVLELDGSGTLVQTIACLNLPTDVRVADGSLFVASVSGTEVIDIASGLVLATLPINGAVHHNSLAKVGSLVAVADAANLRVQLLDSNGATDTTIGGPKSMGGATSSGLLLNTLVTATPLVAHGNVYAETSLGAGYSIEVYQVSAVVGRGFPASLTL